MSKKCAMDNCRWCTADGSCEKESGVKDTACETQARPACFEDC